MVVVDWGIVQQNFFNALAFFFAGTAYKIVEKYFIEKPHKHLKRIYKKYKKKNGRNKR